MSVDSGSGLSRRQMIAAGTTGLIAATAAGPARSAARGRPEAADGTPEQVHLTWGDDPTRVVVVSWASPGQAERPRVRIGQRVITAAERKYTDASTGAVTWTYHARVGELRPGATYGYAVTADNDANAADPFSATFTTAPAGRAAFRFTSFGDLAAPGQAGAAGPGVHWQAAYAVGAVETFQPLFHLLSGDLADVGTGVSPAGDSAFVPGGFGGFGGVVPPGDTVADLAQRWRDFGNHVQASAANRPWLPVPGDHELSAGNGEQGLASYLTRYTLPSNGVEGLEGRWYAFRVGTALFVCLSGDDVAYSAPPEGRDESDEEAPGSFGRGYSRGAQTRWLESTLAAARADASIDWIVVQLHQCACSSAAGPVSRGDDPPKPPRNKGDVVSRRDDPPKPPRNKTDRVPRGDNPPKPPRDKSEGSDLGVRREWLPLFDTYEVDLVLSGHDHGYERSFPVRGFDAGAGTDTLTGAMADTRRPRPVTRVDSSVFDTSQGTVHLVLGSGGTARVSGGPGDSAAPPRTAGVITRQAPPVAGQQAAGRAVPGQRPAGGDPWPGADTAETATWSARRDTAPGHGIAVLDVNPGSETGGQTSITVRYYHAAGPDLPDAGPAGTAPVDSARAAGDYALLETFTLVRPRSDGRRWHPKGLPPAHARARPVAPQHRAAVPVYRLAGSCRPNGTRGPFAPGVTVRRSACCCYPAACYGPSMDVRGVS